MQGNEEPFLTCVHFIVKVDANFVPIGVSGRSLQESGSRLQFLRAERTAIGAAV